MYDNKRKCTRLKYDCVTVENQFMSESKLGDNKVEALYPRNIVNKLILFTRSQWPKALQHAHFTGAMFSELC